MGGHRRANEPRVERSLPRAGHAVCRSHSIRIQKTTSSTYLTPPSARMYFHFVTESAFATTMLFNIDISSPLLLSIYTYTVISSHLILLLLNWTLISWQEWLDLSIQKSIPITLLIMSRAFMLTSSFSNSEDLLMNSISSVSTCIYALPVWLFVRTAGCLPVCLSVRPYGCSADWLMTHPFGLSLLFLPLSFYTVLSLL